MTVTAVTHLGACVFSSISGVTELSIRRSKPLQKHLTHPPKANMKQCIYTKFPPQKQKTAITYCNVCCQFDSFSYSSQNDCLPKRARGTLLEAHCVTFILK